MKAKYYILIFIIGILYFSLSAFSFSSEVDSSNKDIIKFTHKFHLEQELECTDCHTEVESSVDLSKRLVPTMESCGNCHDIEDEEECSTCHYENVLEPFPVKTPELYFSHKSHMENEDAEYLPLSFMKEYPESSLIQRAYWELGKYQFANNKYNNALESFQHVRITDLESGDEITRQLYQFNPNNPVENQFIGGHGFTGLNYVFQLESPDEMQFFCSIK